MNVQCSSLCLILFVIFQKFKDKHNTLRQNNKWNSKWNQMEPNGIPNRVILGHFFFYRHKINMGQSNSTQIPATYDNENSTIHIPRGVYIVREDSQYSPEGRVSGPGLIRFDTDIPSTSVRLKAFSKICWWPATALRTSQPTMT